MKKILILSFAALGFAACKQNPKPMEHSNPFLTEYKTPFEIPPFESIEYGDYLPAIEQGMTEQLAEVEQICSNPDEPTFKNTIEALEVSGKLLNKVSSVFYNLNGSLTNDSMQAIARKLSPLMSKHGDDIALNPTLFSRIKTVFDQRDNVELNGEEAMLLEKTYKRFVRGGALLNDEDKEKLRKINEELSILSLTFGENVLAETNNFKLFIEDSSQLAGLPVSLKSAAAEAANKEGKSGHWLFTLHGPSLFPFLQFADNRDLREQMFKAYINRANHDDERDNKKIISRTAQLRLERANLLGYATHSDFILEQNMASKPQAVREFLMGLMKPSVAKAKEEAQHLQELANEMNDNVKIEAWDWWYYTEKLRKARYDLDEEAMRPYFKLENVRDGVFKTATNLYGLQFVKRNDLPKYHPDVETYEVLEADGSHIGILFMDFFPRASKRGGAWMSSFRKVSNVDGVHIAPIITTNFNFTAPSGDKPALLSWDESTTLFHEFGHALHGLLGNTIYNSLSGTSVPRDFVELPSQVMENWAPEPEVLAYYAFHYETGEVIPQSLIEKMKASSTFNQGFATTEYLAAALLDLDWHTITTSQMIDVDAFEKESRAKSGINSEITSRYKSTYFSHIFSGGYSSGYYSYMWAEVLDSDAFMAFKETQLFDHETAQKFRTNILSKGGTEDPMKLWLAFRGRPAKMDALLEKRGLK